MLETYRIEVGQDRMASGPGFDLIVSFSTELSTVEDLEANSRSRIERHRNGKRCKEEVPVPFFVSLFVFFSTTFNVMQVTG